MHLGGLRPAPPGPDYLPRFVDLFELLLVPRFLVVRVIAPRLDAVHILGVFLAGIERDPQGRTGLPHVPEPRLSHRLTGTCRRWRDARAARASRQGQKFGPAAGDANPAHRGPLKLDGHHVAGPEIGRAIVLGEARDGLTIPVIGQVVPDLGAIARLQRLGSPLAAHDAPEVKDLLQLGYRLVPALVSVEA